MKRMLLSAITLLSWSAVSYAQVIVAGVSPASIQANYTFAVQTDIGWPRYADNQFAPQSENWALAMDFGIPGTYIIDTLVMVNDGSTGNDPVLGNPISDEGCAASTPNAYAGKIAVVRRNNCAFTTKAKNAQDGGAVAVIVVDNINDPNLENNYMSAGAPSASPGGEGPDVTIPVVRISLDDGNALIAEMQNGPVVMFIGNKLGAFQNDLSANAENRLISKKTGVPTQTSQNGTEFSFDLGLRVYNHGIDDQTNITVTAEITGPSGSVYSEVAGPFSLLGFNDPSIDSIDIDPTQSITFPEFNLSTYEEGNYTLTYTIENGSITDDFSSDNVLTSQFRIGNDMLAYSKLDAAGIPAGLGTTRPEPPVNSSFTSCMYFSDPNASRIGVSGLYFAASAIDADDDTPLDLTDEEINAYVYEWTSVFTDINDVPNPFTSADVTELAYVPYYYPSNLANEIVSADFTQQIVLEDDKRYLFCVQSYNRNIRFGYDQKTNYDWNQGLYLDPISVLEVDGDWNPFGFGTDAIPTIGVKIFNAAEIGVSELMTVNGTAFPNPATDKVTLSVETTGNAVLSVTDVAGRAVSSQSLSFANGTSTVDVSGLESGLYIFNVTYDNGQTSQFNVVKK